MAGRLQDVILRGTAALKPLATTVAPGTLYYSTDLAATERCADNGLTWETYADGGGGGGGPLLPHAITHQPGGSDPLAVDAIPATGSLRTLGTGANQAAAGNDSRLTNSRVPTAHAISHKAGGSDALDVKELPGYPGGPTKYLSGDSTFLTLPARTHSINLMIDGMGSVITTGVKGYLEIPFTCVIQSVTLLAGISGSVVVDIWKDTYANHPPTVADTITASAKPTISSALKSQDSTLTGWNKNITAGDILGFNVDSVSLITRLTLSLKVQVP